MRQPSDVVLLPFSLGDFIPYRCGFYLHLNCEKNSGK